MEINLDELYSIGEISKLTGISARMLRHFDKLGILKPHYIDPDNNYRYYKDEQIVIISFLKELRYQNFSLKEIKSFLEDNNVKMIHTLMKKKRDDIQKEIDKLTQSKNRIDDFLTQYSLIFPDNLIYKIDNCHKIEFKNIQKRKIVFINSTTIFSVKQFLEKFAELQKLVSNKNLKIYGSYMSIFHANYSELVENQSEVNFDACIEISDDVSQHHKYIKTLPSGLYLSALFNDTNYKDATINIIHTLNNIIEKGKYTITGDLIKLYHYQNQTLKGFTKRVSEIQIPVKK